MQKFNSYNGSVGGRGTFILAHSSALCKPHWAGRRVAWLHTGARCYELARTVGVSNATYQAHMLQVCCQERHFRTPAAPAVNAAECPSVYLCLLPTIAADKTPNTHLQIANAC